MMAGGLWPGFLPGCGGMDWLRSPRLTNPCTGPSINYHVTTPCSLPAVAPPRLCATAVNAGPVISALGNPCNEIGSRDIP